MTPRPQARLVLGFPLAVVALIALLGAWPCDVRADGGCKPNTQQCQTNISCCSRNCAKPTVKHGAALFGICCPAGESVCPTSTALQCVNLSTDENNCGTCGTICTAPNTCGGGGAAGKCGCTPATSCPAGQNCGTAPDGCGGTLNCGTCTAPQTCGGGRTANVCGCTPTTCGAQDCGSIPDGCGGMLDCGPCPTTTTTTAVTTTTTIPASCGTHPAELVCHCGPDGPCQSITCASEQCGNGTFTCGVLQETCSQMCMADSCDPGTCATALCTDCTTGQPCQ